jgi:hypothetical protein
MTLDVGEFIRRFLIHVLPKGFHRIRHYGLFAGSNRAETIETVREFLFTITPLHHVATNVLHTVSRTQTPSQPEMA